MGETLYAILGASALFLICYGMFKRFADPSVHYSITAVVLTSWYTNILCVILFSFDLYYVSSILSPLIVKTIEEQQARLFDL